MSAPEEPDSVPVAKPLGGCRVLIVDDHADTLDMLRQACDFHGASVSTAASAREAVALLRDEPPDAIITDIGLRGEDGVWLLGEVRRTHGAIPVIALTGRSPEGALAAGFDAVMLKPADPWQVCDEVRRLLSSPRSAAEG